MAIKFSRKKTGPRLLWTPPDTLPSLKDAPIIAIDTETKDEGLDKGIGPGGVHGMGHLLGISVSVEGWSAYIPLRHPESDNFKIKEVRTWFNREMTRVKQPKLGANILYDLEWLRSEGFNVLGTCYDVQDAEALLDENRGKYSLSSLTEKYLDERYQKATADQEEFANTYLGSFKGDVRAHLWRLPASHVGGYAEMDAICTRLVWEEQKPLLDADKLWRVFDVECRLKPLLLGMRFKGVRIDTNQVERVEETLKKRIEKGHKKLKKIAGVDFNVNSPKEQRAAFEKIGLPMSLTAKGNPTFAKERLKTLNHPLSKQILVLRKDEHLLDTFIHGMLMKYVVKGRIHTQFNQLRGDEYGTVSGRFSSSRPNLQQVPAVDEEQGALIRSLFIPEPGEEWWKIDWSQIEFRLFVHYAFRDGLPRAGEAVEAYRNDPSTDYHQWAAELLGLPRRIAKNINFGLIYGMGKRALAAALEMSMAEIQPTFVKYHHHIPYARQLTENVSRIARNRGYVTTLLGRRRRFTLYEPNNHDYNDRKPALPYELAVLEYGTNIRVAYVHKALNSVIQGSAADLMKLSMVQSYEEGLFDVDALGMPSLTVHDELDGSKRKRNKAARQAFERLIEVMETSFDLSIPILADAQTGPDWWNVKPYKRKAVV